MVAWDLIMVSRFRLELVDCVGMFAVSPGGCEGSAGSTRETGGSSRTQIGGGPEHWRLGPQVVADVGAFSSRGS